MSDRYYLVSVDILRALACKRQTYDFRQVTDVTKMRFVSGKRQVWRRVAD
ncbi:hypothetical protein Q7O_003660 [Pectobacterium carotovorum subsp. carotovorum PCCS1]|nr:hypothetical protein [Pectobacterium carotovorum subsp. carotovorum PCCS1]